MAVFLLQAKAKRTEQSAIEAALKAAIPDLADVASLEAALKSHAAGSPDKASIVIAVLPQQDRGYFDQLIDFATRHGNEIFLILMGDEISASDYKRLIRSGGADWTSAKADMSEVLDIIARRHLDENNGSGPRRPTRSRPVTISFVPSAGGVGNTTLIVEVAAHIKTDKASRQRKICIVDLDFQTSHVCDYLDSEPRLHIAEFSNAPERLDEQLFESFRTRHSSGIDVFAAPRSKFASESLNVDALDSLFSMIAAHYDLMLIDYPLSWFRWTAQIIAASDGAVVTGINTIPCLRQVSETIAMVRSSAPTTLNTAVAINKCERTMLGSISRRKHVELVLRDERLFFIANRPEAVEGVNMGAPMMLGASPGGFRKDFGPLANFCGSLSSSRLVSG